MGTCLFINEDFINNIATFIYNTEIIYFSSYKFKFVIYVLIKVLKTSIIN